MSSAEPIDKKFELLRFNRSNYKDDVVKAFKLMESYIIAQGITLVGGMAMDFALRLKNAKLYADDAIPDYDCLSPTHVHHAFDFANQLCKEGFKGVDVIRALHMTTMRVRFNGQVIMDVTYMPQVIYDKLLRLEYRGMMTIHPWYSMMDQLGSMAHPFTRPPQEALMERLVKDNKRFALMLEYYPLSNKDPTLKGKRTLPPPVSVLKPFTMPKAATTNCVISGWCALAYHLSDSKLGKLVDTKTLKFSIPENAVPSLYTTTVDAFTETKGVKFYNPTMELARHAHVNGLDVYDASKRIITVDSEDARFVSFHFCIWEFMTWWLWRGDQYAFYGAQALVQHALNTTQVMSIASYGTRTLEDSFIFNILAYRNPEMRRMAPVSNYTYGTDCDIEKKFDYNSSEFFAIDGSETTRFSPVLSADIDLRCT